MEVMVICWKKAHRSGIGGLISLKTYGSNEKAL